MKADSKTSRTAGKCTLILAFIIILSLICALRPFAVAKGDPGALSLDLQPISLSVGGLDGTQVTLDENDIAGLQSYEARGGYKNSLGNIRGLGNYTGVPLVSFCNLVGGINDGNTLRATSTDLYSINLTYAQVNGSFVTYDPATGDLASPSQPLTPILAYYKDDQNLSESEGPLRLAIVGPEGLATDSIYWAKFVVKLEIFRSAVPEFQPAFLMPLFMTATLLVVVAYSRRLGRKKSAGE